MSNKGGKRDASQSTQAQVTPNISLEEQIRDICAKEQSRAPRDIYFGLSFVYVSVNLDT